MKTLEELNLVDDFLVNSLTSHKVYGEQSARYILECILHRPIGKLTVVPQRFFGGENTEAHGIRLDVYLDEENGEILILSLTRMTEREISQHFPVEHVFIMQRSMQEICRQAKNMESFEM